MADMTMCNIQYCKMTPFCLRHNAEPNPHYQSYLVNPEKTCRDDNYEYYIRDKKGI